MVNHQQVLLVFAASLEGPVEGACEEEFGVNEHEFVVHVSHRIRISPHWNAIVGQHLTIVALVCHRFIVGDNAHINTVSVSFQDSIGQFVIGKVEHANDQTFLGFLNVANQFVDV